MSSRSTPRPEGVSGTDRPAETNDGRDDARGQSIVPAVVCLPRAQALTTCGMPGCRIALTASDTAVSGR